MTAILADQETRMTVAECVALLLHERDACAVRKRQSPVNVLARDVPTSLALILLAAGVLTTGDWGRVLGVAVALVVMVPLFWLLNHPRRQRRRLRAVASSE